MSQIQFHHKDTKNTKKTGVFGKRFSVLSVSSAQVFSYFETASIPQLNMTDKLTTRNKLL